MILILIYPPGAGGNHLRNLITLSGRFDQQWPWPWVKEQQLGLTVYDHHAQPRGTVHQLPGRNMHAIFADEIVMNPHREFIIHGHFGEMIRYRERLAHIPDRFMISITSSSEQDQNLLDQRQARLQHRLHPYYLREEQPLLYAPDLLAHCFGLETQRVLSVPFQNMMQHNIGAVLSDIRDFCGIAVDADAAQTLHSKWLDMNRH